MTQFQMLLFLVGVHILGFIAVAILIIPALRDNDPGSDAGDSNDGSDDGWGNRPNVKPDPSRWPGGGIPLPDAVQSKVRLREPGRLTEHLTAPERRPAREPERTPVRTGS
jgi:hypothetical protein